MLWIHICEYYAYFTIATVLCFFHKILSGQSRGVSVEKCLYDGSFQHYRSWPCGSRPPV